MWRWLGALVATIGAAGVAVVLLDPGPATELPPASTENAGPTVPDDDTEGKAADTEIMGSWALVAGSVDGQEIPIEPALVLRVTEDRFRFPLACNSASVPYEVEGTSIAIDIEGFASSEEGCSSIQADLFEMALLRVRTVSVDVSGERLTLEGPEVDLRFAAGDI